MNRFLLVLSCTITLLFLTSCSKKCSCTIIENDKERIEEIDLTNTEYQKCQELNSTYAYKGGTASINCNKSK